MIEAQDPIDVITNPAEGELPPEPDAEQIASWISEIVTQIDKSERSTRDRMLRLWKYLELLWSGAGNYYWDHTAGQWRAITQEDIALISRDADIDPTLVNKVVNVIRPYGESLAGVLTTGLPRVKYFPRDADKELDIQAAKAYSNVEKRIVDDNMMPLKLIEAIVKLWNGGYVAAYNYSHTDKKYGTVKQPVMVDNEFNQDSMICTNCGNEVLGEQIFKVDEAEEEQAPDTDISPDEMLDQEDEVMPEVPPMSMDEGMDMDMPEVIQNDCPECGMVTPHIKTSVSGIGQQQVDEVETPKSRQIIEMYGPMNVKIPSLATKKEEVSWLILEKELSLPDAKHLYPDYRDKISASVNGDIDVDRLARTTYEIADDTLREAATIRKVWLMPAQFERLGNIEDVMFMKNKYPNGIKAIFCADIYLEAEEEDINDHWTISINPLYPRLMADPLGKALIGLHETTNDLFQLEVDTVRYSIPQTFVDPKVLDTKAYSQTRANPGAITPVAKAPAGGKISDAFFETKTATIPKEVENLDYKVERLLQFISGVLPSVFGGPATGSKTLGEYEQSKNQALQRLSIVWKVISVLYAECMAKATKMYVRDLKEDEHFVQEKGTGNFINVYIRREAFKGEIGEVRPELSEQFPMTWGQISARVMELLTMGNEVITAWLLHPENIEIIYQVLGISDLHIPGEDQRNKQLYEISEMMFAAATPVVDPNTGQQMIDPTTGQPGVIPSVMIEPIDDDVIHMEVIKAFLNSGAGIELKETNQVAYTNIMTHYLMHQQRLMQMQAAQQQAQVEATDEGSSEQVQES